MADGNFTLAQLKKTFGLCFEESSGLFANLPRVDGSEGLVWTLSEGIDLAVAIGTEKARSEMIITPVLMELRRLYKSQISLFSGVDFTVSPEQGLNSVCDYLISYSKEQLLIQSPVIMLVEAKNENLKVGLPQCIAEMVAAQQFNQQENDIAVIYGAVTIGTTWQFLRLKGQVVEIDLMQYPIQNNLSQILGVLSSALAETTCSQSASTEIRPEIRQMPIHET